MPSKIKIKKEKLFECPVCNSVKFKEVFVEGKGYQYNINERAKYSKCSTCKAIFQNPRIPSEHIKYYYQKNYYTHNKTNKNFSTENENLGMINKIKLMKWKIISLYNYRFPKLRGSFLDYGAGSGSFLNILQRQGWSDLWGFDPDPKPFICKKNSVKRIDQKDLFPLNDKFKNKFKYILSHHSIEHISNPLPIMKLWYKILQPNGTLTIATPNVNSLSFKLFKNYWYFLTPPHHYIIFSPESLKISLEKIGFKIESIEFHSSSQCFWGSLDFMIQSKRIEKNKKIKMYLNNSKILKLISKPLIFFLDMLSLGDNLVIKATKI